MLRNSMRRKAVVVKKNALVRAGVEMTTAEAGELLQGTAIAVLERGTSSKGVARARVRSADGTAGWVSSKVMRCEAIATVRVEHSSGTYMG